MTSLRARTAAPASLLAFLATVILSAPGRASETGSKQPAGVPREPAREADGPEQIRARVRLYLDRHGDRGVIDPERCRARVAAEYERWREERRGKGVSTIGGDQWVSLGPTNGAGRMTAIAFPPNAPGTAFVGAAGGGVWKTTDGGSTWTPLTDGLNDLAVGALAVAPSDPRVIYLGTGEGGYAIDFIPGIGLLKSTDGGATWILPSSVVATEFYRISVHPNNARELVAGTNAGAIRSTDGGATWSTVISPAAYGDVSDLVRDPTDPSTLWATTWCPVANCATNVSKVLRSTDFGVTWSERSAGLPSRAGLDRHLERMAIAIAPSSPFTLYAARGIGGTQTTSHIYKTTDAGATWQELPLDDFDHQYMDDQSWYDNVLVVSPTNPNAVIAGGVFYLRSTDGSTFNAPIGRLHADCHDLQYQGSTLWIANDGGIWTSPDDGETLVDRNAGLVTTQFYALAIDSTHGYRILAGSQDNGTQQRPDYGGTEWNSVLGGDGFECAILPQSPETEFGTIYGGRVFRAKDASSTFPNFLDATPPYESGENTPFLSVFRVDPTSASTIYTGTYRVWRSRDGGTTWAPLPTTTLDGSIWTNGSRTWVAAIALSRTDPLLLLVARRDGLIFRSGDGGRTWASGSGLSGAIVNNVEIDPKNASIAYAAMGSTTTPSLYRSTDGGRNWLPSSSGLPPFAAQVVRVDPTDSSDVFCGTDVGVFRSRDTGVTWTRFGTGLPASSVQNLQILEDGSMVRMATHGRGIWELQVAPTGNQPPMPTIFLPAGPVTVPPGSVVTFAGIVTETDAADAVTGTWTFSDTAELVPLAAPTAHMFHRPGVFPISLVARDSRGAVVAATVVVTVTNPADACASPVILPGAGPFPYAVVGNNESSNLSNTNEPPCPGTTSPIGSVWFEFTPRTSGSYEFSTCGSPLNTVLGLVEGPACGPYTSFYCGDDNLTPGCEEKAALLTVSLTAGQTSRIQVRGSDVWDLGTFPLTVRVGGDTISPRITGVDAAQGPPGGAAVLIVGSNFMADAIVAFDGVPATEVLVLGPTAISARAPAHAPGSVDVSVTTSAGTGTLGHGFTYTSVTSVPCVATSSALCLNGGRFRVEVEWRVPTQNQSGLGAGVPLTADTGYFWFFSANNIELVVKVVDGRGFNGKFWVFYGALSNVEYKISVTDTVTGAVRVYANPSGQLSSVADTAAF